MIIKPELILATKNDLELLYFITQQGMAHISKSENYSTIEKKSHFKKYKDEFLPHIQNNNTYLILLGQIPIGRLRLDPDINFIHIGGMQFLPEYTGQGFGTFVINWLKQQAGKRNITLMVHKNNPKAIHFYEVNGFKICLETENQYKMIY